MTYKYHRIPRLRDGNLDAELQRISGYDAAWYNVALALKKMPELEQEMENSSALKHRTSEKLRHEAIQHLELMLLILDALYIPCTRRRWLLPLNSLLVALKDLEEGLNSRILVTGDLANQLPEGSFSTGWHRRIRREAAVLVGFMLWNGLEPNQLSASKRVAEFLTKGGYAPPGQSRHATPVRPDTVKRWHNSARTDAGKLGDSFREALQSMHGLVDLYGSFEATAQYGLESLERTCSAYRILDS